MAKKGKIKSNVPINLSEFYKNEWISWGHFLGTDNVSYKLKKFFRWFLIGCNTLLETYRKIKIHTTKFLVTSVI